jgi:hypothetical protein
MVLPNLHTLEMKLMPLATRVTRFAHITSCGVYAGSNVYMHTRWLITRYRITTEHIQL